MTCQLLWAHRPDNLKVSVLAHRAAAHGHSVSLVDGGYAGPDSLAAAAQSFGLQSSVQALHSAGSPLQMPRIVLFCGSSIGYPYYAYYAHSLLSLGLIYSHADATDITSGILTDADVLIIPGGFANWGLDRAESHVGVDHAIELFLQKGGALIGSCGGAFYASQGRPGWLGLIDAKPMFTHEYLQTGAAVVNVHLTNTELRGDLPETLELAYYHGPVYDDRDRLSKTLARYAQYVLPSRLLIDNPLERARYEALMQGKPAILESHVTQGRIIVFSPHPEMGDFVRKGIALDGYIRHYLPLRGFKTMDETLRFYAQEDCLGFRLILNSLLRLGVFNSPPKPTVGIEQTSAPLIRNDLSSTLTSIRATRQRKSEHLLSRLVTDEPEMATLVQHELQRQQEQWLVVGKRIDAYATTEGADLQVLKELTFTLRDAAAFLESAPDRSVADGVVSLELPIRLTAACVRLLHCDEILKETL
ncbi:MAG: hypothetical protein ABI155_16900 [Paralcaligenes sp.]